MSSIKVSALTAKTTPSGSEELLINDGGVSKKITQTNLLSTALPLAGGTMTGNITLGTNTIDGLEINTTATSNLGLGTGAVDSITTGDYNVGVGDYALSSVDAGSNNTAIGYVTLNTTTSGNGNTSAGFYSLVVNTAGSYNVASGFKALHANTTASGNTGIGYYALAGNTTGINNVALGYQAGTTNTTGSSNIIIGDTVNAPSATASNQLNIGNTIYGDTSTGKVGIGTTSPESVVNIKTTKTVALSAAAHFLTLGLTIDDSTAYDTEGGGGGIAFRSPRNSIGTQTVYAAIDGAKEGTASSGYTGALKFYTNNNATGIPTEHLRITSAGDVKVNTGNLVIGTSGKGIDFSADGNAAGMTSEVLDDYEEGTWTPTINGYSGGSTQTYSAQAGNYTKIGNTVTAHFYVRLSAKGDISGNYTHLRGLPYNHSGSVAGTLNINIYYGLASARSWISGEAGGSSPTSIWLTTSSNSTATSYLNTSLLTDTFGLRGTLVYEI